MVSGPGYARYASRQSGTIPGLSCCPSWHPPAVMGGRMGRVRLIAGARPFTAPLVIPNQRGPRRRPARVITRVLVEGIVEPPHRYATTQQRVYVLTRDRYRCAYCRCRVTMRSANIDHVLPYRDGGPTTVANLVACCRRCNKLKGNKHLTQQLHQKRKHPWAWKAKIRTSTHVA